jgi:phosphatidylglycerophosphatase A
VESKCIRHTVISRLKWGDFLRSRRSIEIFATFFYLGRVPLIPGTVGTLGAIPLVYLFTLAGTYGYMALTFVFVLWSINIADKYEAVVQDHDTGDVVIDEVAGFLITMFWMPLNWQAFLYGFILFRLLDIIKPFPISVLDRRAKGGFGTVVDDLVAGVIANIIMQFMYTQTDWLGVRYVFGS